jgi:hypothetical protein
MPDELPIACSLTAAELPKRLTEIAALGREALVDVRNESTRAELRFADRAGVHQRVDAIVAAESECCAFLTMRVSNPPGLVVLNIEAPEDAELVLQELVATFRADDDEYAESIAR